MQIGSRCLFTDEVGQEIVEVVIEGVTAPEKASNPFGYDLIVRDLESTRQWQVQPDELEPIVSP